MQKKNNLKPFEGSTASLVSDTQEMIIMVGMPASGKSSFVKKYLVPKGYTRINRDTLKTQAKCMAVAQESLSSGKSVVIDNTNPNPESRAQYVDIARKFKIPCRCFLMTSPRKLADHLNIFRENLTEGATPRIPDIAFNVYKKKYKEPTKTEGFTEIKKINFVPEFSSEQEKEVFLKWV